MRLALVLLVGTLAFVSGCSDDDGNEDGSGSGAGAQGVGAIDLAGTSWTLDTLGGDEAVTDGIPTLEFATDGTVSGTTGCNQYGGTFEVDGSELSIEIGPMTLAACSAELEQQQQGLLDAFAATALFSGGEESFLELLDAGGAVLATFFPR